jgi:hypothetical protein
MNALKWLARKTLPKNVRLILRTRFKDHIVPDDPHLDEEGGRYFKERITRTRIYLEYGSGGSTIWAYKATKVMVSVDSDARFIEAVKRKLENIIEPHAEATLIVSNIGFSEEWGVPIFKRPTARRLKKWEHYIKSPWKELQSRALEPDTILVDGRFRVACALHSVLNLAERSRGLILVDDYCDRPYYRGIEEFANVCEVYGRLVVFQKKHTFNAERCKQTIAEYSKDWR